ncbi:dTDP-4-dehydrorhamnose reductase [Candidatus Saganbacteria bacterium CG08_land_8_20_14_0_20_45_16]|uniref:dTDP-4-dehydrorhamnose reductase n=1 Tax=Candidatus Saganbacteria bacterium CG08_land_8_20_14_0_20_45_16 TaxID=2014293 RepID=A0A2H0XZA3_UNCSA|nr:MAG: dTDP-4-dehydrorhamnose reductase [Candidatus Saganbacteria bacterium CG08_land_8_20_14_0_20_45_16]
MKILVIGADGQLGSDLSKIISASEQIPLTIKELDITDREKILAIIKKYSPQVVINTAAYHNVDACEDNLVPAFAVNTIGVKYLAEACLASNSVLLHISTDYVFDGTKGQPYLETDTPNPQSIYAVSKLAGEQIVKYMLKRYFIVRSTGLYGAAGCLGKGGTNFVETILKRAAVQPELQVVTDEVLSPTYTFDLATAINVLIRTEHFGLYHIVNHGQCSWHEFVVKIFELLGQKPIINKVTGETFKSKAKRPKYSVLANANLAKLGLDKLRPWPEALQAYLTEKGYLQNAHRPNP